MRKYKTVPNIVTVVWVCIGIFFWPILMNSVGHSPADLLDADYFRIPAMRFLGIAVWLYPIAVLLALLGCYSIHRARGISWFGWILVWLPLLSILSIFLFISGIGSMY